MQAEVDARGKEGGKRIHTTSFRPCLREINSWSVCEMARYQKYVETYLPYLVPVLTS